MESSGSAKCGRRDSLHCQLLHGTVVLPVRGRKRKWPTRRENKSKREQPNSECRDSLQIDIAAVKPPCQYYYIWLHRERK